MRDDPVTVDVYVRSRSPRGARAYPPAVIERLDALAEEGRVDEYSVDVWGADIPLPDEAGDGPAALAAIERFREWARQRGVALAGFERRHAATLTGETHDVLTPPVVTLAEYAADDLVSVAPHTTEDGIVTVEDRLGRLTGRDGTRRSSGTEDAADDPVPRPRYDTSRV